MNLHALVSFADLKMQWHKKIANLVISDHLQDN